MNLIHIYVSYLVFKGVNRTYVISFFQKSFNIGMYSDIYRPNSFKLGMMIVTT